MLVSEHAEGEIVAENLKPWSLGVVWNAFAYIFIVFMCGIAGLIVWSVWSSPSSNMTVVSKVLIVVLSAGGVGGAVSTFMWRLSSRHVTWDESFWAFVSGPAPEYPEARRAWVWGRWFMACWLTTMGCIGVVAVVEMCAGHWK